MTTALTGEQCDKGLVEDGSMEQKYVSLRISPFRRCCSMQRRMMQYAKENGFESGNENKFAGIDFIIRVEFFGGYEMR